MSKGKTTVPTKGTMNLYYKPDRTTKPATIALYVLFALTVLLGLSKVLVYDLWVQVEETRAALVDRMDVLFLLDSAIGTGTQMNSITITGDEVQVRFSGVTLAQTARIVSTLESSPLVAGTTVTTASTTQEEGALVLATVHIKLQKEVAE